MKQPRRIDAPPAAVAVLVVVTLTAGLMLGATDAATRERITQLKQAEQESIMRQALGGPTELNQESGSDGKGEMTWFTGKTEGRVVGHSYAVKSPGYGGDIEAAVAIDTAGAVRKVFVLSHGETPGLGSKITEEAFLARFEGRKGGDAGLEIKKLGGEIDAVTGATISSRAVLAAVREALALEGRRATLMSNQAKESTTGGGG